MKWLKLDIADRVKRADEIERARLAWYECDDCNRSDVALDVHHKPGAYKKLWRESIQFQFLVSSATRKKRNESFINYIVSIFRIFFVFSTDLNLSSNLSPITQTTSFAEQSNQIFSF
mgnify:CR=1 FL=1